MLQVARLAPNLLLEAGDRVVEFLRGQINDDGGGKDRAGDSDLYYTVFTLEGLIAMRAEPDFARTREYLAQFGHGGELDFVHLSCLARCWAALPGGAPDDAMRHNLLERIETFRSSDGAYGDEPGEETGTIYNNFLALGAYQDLGETIPNPQGLIDNINTLRTDDGAYSNDIHVRIGTAPTTAAAVTLLRQLDVPIPQTVGEWLRKQCHASGGFLAIPFAPMPDLLSTATVLHALAGMHVPFEDLKDRCLDFIDSLWTGRAFCGYWEDDIQDSEYTYYALLALGHLSL